MTPTQFLLALRARLGVLVMIVAATVLAATAGSLLLPKSYDATASLLVDARDEQSLSNSQRPILMPQERLSYLQTQRDILGSRKVARKVVHDLQLARQPSPYLTPERAGDSAAAIEDRLSEALLKRLKVETSQSNVIQATYSSADPAFSARVANAFAKAYIDTMLELRVVPAREAAAWFDQQLKGLRTNLETAQARLTTLHQQEQVVSMDEHVDVENARLAALSEEVVRAQSQTFQWRSRAQQARSFIESGARNGTALDTEGNLGPVKGVPNFRTTAPGLYMGDQRIIIGERGQTRFRMMKPWTMGQLQDQKDANGRFTGKKEAYGDQFVVIHTPTQLKAAYTSLVLYSGAARVDR